MKTGSGGGGEAVLFYVANEKEADKERRKVSDQPRRVVLLHEKDDILRRMHLHWGGGCTLVHLTLVKHFRVALASSKKL